MRSTRSQLAKHRRGRLPCWTDITDRLRGKRAESPKEYRGTDPAHIPDRVSPEVTATMVESKRRTTRRSPTEDCVPIPEKHRARPVRKSVSEKRIPTESIQERRLTLVRQVSATILFCVTLYNELKIYENISLTIINKIYLIIIIIHTFYILFLKYKIFMLTYFQNYFCYIYKLYKNNIKH